MRFLQAIVVLVATLPHLWAQSTVYNPSHSLELSGRAAGGTLVLAMPPLYWSQVSVETKQGETAASVVQRLFQKMREIPSLPEGDRMRAKHLIPRKRVMVRGARIVGLWGKAKSGWYMLTGTENGLGIPPSPKSVTLRYDFETDKLHIFWETAKGIDAVAFFRNNNGGYVYTEYVKKVGNTREYALHRVSSGPTPGNYFICGVNYRQKTPSAGSMVRLNGNRLTEENVMSFPGGVAPSWTSYESKTGIGRFLGIKTKSKIPGAPNEYYQKLSTAKADDKPYRFGVYRKFLGLRKGKNYRIGLKWFCSGNPGSKAALKVCASGIKLDSTVPAGKIQRGKSARTLLDAKPTESNPKATDESAPQWNIFATGTQTCPDLKLSEDCQALLVWVELEGQGSSKVSAGFDDLYLEELPDKASK